MNVKRILKLAGIGFLLGIAVCNVITFLTCDTVPASPEFVQKIGSVRAALFIQMFVAGLHGALCMGSVEIYEADRIPLAAASLVHCFICIVPFAFFARALCWANGTTEVLLFVAIQVAAYFVVWLIMYVRYRKETKELNEIQKQILNNANPDKTKNN